MVGERNVDSRVPVPVPTWRTTGAQAGKEIKTFARPEDFIFPEFLKKQDKKVV